MHKNKQLILFVFKIHRCYDLSNADLSFKSDGSKNTSDDQTSEHLQSKPSGIRLILKIILVTPSEFTKNSQKSQYCSLSKCNRFEWHSNGTL